MFLNIDSHSADSVAAIDDTQRELTYASICEFSLEYSKLIPVGSLVFLLCDNSVGALAHYIACVENKVVPLLLGASIDEELLLRLYEIYRPQYFCVPEPQTDDMLEKIPGISVLYKRHGYSILQAGNNPAAVLNEKLALLMSTSGSTGSPKLVRYTRKNLESNARNVAKVFGWTASEKPICDLPMNYTMGLNVINSHLYVGATVVLTKRNLMSQEFWDVIRSQDCTNFTGVPFSYTILSRLRFEKMETPKLTTLAEGGGRLSNAEFEKWANYAKENGKRFFATFGTTETAARMSYLPPEWAAEKIGSIGIAIPEGELFLLDDDGQAISEMEAEGELAYRGPNVTMGYATCREELSLGDVFSGEYHTGDIARRDKDGCYYIVGRKSRFLKLLGFRVNLDESERLIRDKFGVDNVCMGTDDKMIIYITDSEYRESVKEFMSNKTRLYSSLFEIRYIDKIPRSQTGKIMYKQLEKAL